MAYVAFPIPQEFKPRERNCNCKSSCHQNMAGLNGQRNWPCNDSSDEIKRPKCCCCNCSCHANFGQTQPQVVSKTVKEDVGGSIEEERDMFEWMARERLKEVHAKRESVIHEYVSREPLKPEIVHQQAQPKMTESRNYLNSIRLVQRMKTKWEAMTETKNPPLVQESPSRKQTFAEHLRESMIHEKNASNRNTRLCEKQKATNASQTFNPEHHVRTTLPEMPNAKKSQDTQPTYPEREIMNPIMSPDLKNSIKQITPTGFESNDPASQFRKHQDNRSNHSIEAPTGTENVETETMPEIPQKRSSSFLKAYAEQEIIVEKLKEENRIVTPTISSSVYESVEINLEDAEPSFAIPPGQRSSIKSEEGLPRNSVSKFEYDKPNKFNEESLSDPILVENISKKSASSEMFMSIENGRNEESKPQVPLNDRINTELLPQLLPELPMPIEDKPNEKAISEETLLLLSEVKPKVEISPKLPIPIDDRENTDLLPELPMPIESSPVNYLPPSLPLPMEDETTIFANASTPKVNLSNGNSLEKLNKSQTTMPPELPLPIENSTPPETPIVRNNSSENKNIHKKSLEIQAKHSTSFRDQELSPGVSRDFKSEWHWKAKSKVSKTNITNEKTMEDQDTPSKTVSNKRLSLDVPPTLPKPVEDIKESLTADVYESQDFQTPSYVLPISLQEITHDDNLILDNLSADFDETVLTENDSQVLRIQKSKSLTSVPTEDLKVIANSLSQEGLRNSKPIQRASLTKNYEREFHICQKCKKIVKAGEATFQFQNGRQSIWHKRCFVCTTCQKPLKPTDSLFFEGEPYCFDHYVVLANVPKCHACAEFIFENHFTLTQGYFWHQAHFVCFKCLIPIVDTKYVVVDDHAYCFSCHQKDFIRVCNSCRKTILPQEPYVQSRDYYWHSSNSCLQCKTCERTLVDRTFFFRKAGHLYCNKYCSLGRSPV